MNKIFELKKDKDGGVSLTGKSSFWTPNSDGDEMYKTIDSLPFGAVVKLVVTVPEPLEIAYQDVERAQHNVACFGVVTGTTTAYFNPDHMFGNNEENKMTELKNFNKKNLKEAKQLAMTEKNNKEVQTAKHEYERLIDCKENQERFIREAEKELVIINESLKVFAVK